MAVIDEPVVESAETNPRPASALLQVAAAVGVAAGVVGSARAGLGSALLLGVLAGGLVHVLGNRRGLVRLVAGAAALVPFLVIRDNSWLALCIVFTSGLVGSFAAIAAATDQRVFDFRLGAIFRLLPAAPKPLGPAVARTRPSFAVSIVRGSALALVITWSFWSLLAEADAVFGTIVNLGPLPLGRAAFGVFVGIVFLPVAAVAALNRSARPSTERRPLGMVECTMVLAALDLLFLAFVALRLGNLGEPLSEDAWRSEVRSGFFQLLFVAALTILLLLALRRIVRIESPSELRTFRVLSLTTVVLAALIDVIALQRIAEYVQRNFMTPLRWWSFGFGLFLLAVLVLVAARAIGWRSDREWISGAIVSTWMVFVAVMALSNPDQRMADYNFDHPRESDGVISVQALFWLSEDATPVIVDRIDALRPLSNTRFERMVQHLCATEPKESWRHLNFARSDAADATKELCAP